MEVTLVVAHDLNRTIGNPKGNIPWHLPKDVKRFRDLAKGATMVLGRRTFEEMNNWFIDQQVFLMTKQENYTPHYERIILAKNVEFVLHKTKELEIDSLLVAGGAQVYESWIERATKLEITRIEAEVESGPKFPVISQSDWQCVDKEDYEADENHEYKFSFETWIPINK